MFELAPTPIYVTVALLAAFASMITTYIGNKEKDTEINGKKPAVKRSVYFCCDILIFGVWISCGKVIAYILNELYCYFSTFDIFEITVMCSHMICYGIVAILAGVWYSAMTVNRRARPAATLTKMESTGI